MDDIIKNQLLLFKEKLISYLARYETSTLSNEEITEQANIKATLERIEMMLASMSRTEALQNEPSSAQKGLIETDPKGWLDVMTDDGQRITISKYTRVTYHGYNSDKTRETFTILDWPNENIEASVSAISASKSRFAATVYQGPGVVTFDLDNNRLKYGNSAWIHTATDINNPISKGSYNLWLPDGVHTYGNPYLGLSNYATVWYRIGAEGSSRYFHVGNVSAGCVTVGEASTGGQDVDKKQWTDIYNYLKTRRSGSKHVGTINII
ncbi:MAG: Unknown protein [uncultured Aureispira sp.]|uniref:YkuD domain-containing protein n=1 Tax=uncultured Aureispira sp. TaxID=1331704 RepID=A0A6S6UIB4_9BACT|nr:MAG: Unknown protein [uncultured Aureispira sp.]